jgi:CRP/FNR family transcriptional regulator, cyclic AMP receptor protein
VAAAERNLEQVLAEVPLFASLTPDQLSLVAPLATRLEFPAASRLVAEGQIGREFLVVLEGEVEVCHDGEVVVTRGPGSYVGEIALLHHRPRTASVLAVTHVVAAVIDAREFATLLADVPELREAITSTVAQRLADLAGHEGI